MKPNTLATAVTLFFVVAATGCTPPQPDTKAQKKELDAWLSDTSGKAFIDTVKQEFPSASSCTINTVRRDGKVLLYLRIIQEETLAKEAVQNVINLLDTSEVPHAEGILLDDANRVTLQLASEFVASQ